MGRHPAVYVMEFFCFAFFLGHAAWLVDLSSPTRD